MRQQRHGPARGALGCARLPGRAGNVEVRPFDALIDIALEELGGLALAPSWPGVEGIDLLVAGVFEVNDAGLITLWRDYFDMGKVNEMFTALAG